MSCRNTSEQLELFRRFIPVGWRGGRSEVTELAMFLASDASSFISGAGVTVSGAV